MSNYTDRSWVILTASEAESIDFSKVLESSADTLNWNNDKTKTFVKYNGPQPAFLSGKPELNHEEILAELNNSEWTIPVE